MNIKQVGAVVALAGLSMLGTPLAAAHASGDTAGAGATPAVQTAQSDLVSQTPSTTMPNITNGSVQAVTQVGDTIVAGGTFTQVIPNSGGSALTRDYIVAFNAQTGALSTSFLPQINGRINALAPSADGTAVYVGGQFSSVNGVKTKNLTELSLATGQAVSGFKPGKVNKAINALHVSQGRLWIGGAFTKVGSHAQVGLAAVNATTGAADPFMSLALAGQQHGGATAVKDFDISPDGSRLVLIGNFTMVGGQANQQIAMLDLTGSSAQLANWQTNAYVPQCASAFDTYMRRIDISPDGAYFVVSVTGAYGGTSKMCDTTARWDFSQTGSNIQPTWVDFTGGDTTYGVAITGAAVYVGGHFRWENNPYAGDRAGQGSVSRQGIAALDPSNGLPLQWNPGRKRGTGVFDMLATSAGLWVGADTSVINGKDVGRLGFLPLTGGSTIPSTATPQLPAEAYVGGTSSNLVGRSFDGQHAGSASTIPSPIQWSQVHGAFYINGTLYYGSTDGNLYARTFDGTNFGSAVNVNGMDAIVSLSSFHSEVPSITGMVFDSASGRLYYTRSGSTSLYYRYFTPSSAIVGGLEYTVPNTTSINLASADGMFLSGSTLYVVNGSNGNLQAVSYSATAGLTGNTTNVSGPGIDGTDWRGNGVFLGPTPAANQSPVATATVTCPTLTCTFDGSESYDPDGTIASYAWSLSDGTTSDQAAFTHTFAAPGTYTYTLTVTDNDSATGQTSASADPSDPQASKIAFVAAGGASNSGANPTVTIPGAVQSGDVIILSVGINSTTTVPQVPAGWTALGSVIAGGQHSALWWKQATTTDGGSSLTVQLSQAQKSAIQVLAYSGVNTTNPVDAIRGAADPSSTSHTTPTVTATAGDWLVSIWSDKSSSTTQWTPSVQGTTRDTEYSPGSGRITALAEDSNGPVDGGTQGGLTATTDGPGGRAATWSIALASQ